ADNYNFFSKSNSNESSHIPPASINPPLSSPCLPLPKSVPQSNEIDIAPAFFHLHCPNLHLLTQLLPVFFQFGLDPCNMMENGVAEDLSDSPQRPDSSGNDQRVYFVPYRWWKETNDDSAPEEESDGKKNKGVLYTATSASPSYGGPMKLINNMFNSDLLFNLRRMEEGGLLQNGEGNEVGVSGRDFALVSGEMWVKALKWHSDAKISSKRTKTFLAAEDDMSDVYPLQLRLSLQQETNSLGVKISKKDNGPEFLRRADKIFTVESEMLRIWDFSGSLFSLLDQFNPRKDSPPQLDQEVLLELQVYGLSDNTKNRERKNGVVQYSNGTYPSGPLVNGSMTNGTFHSKSAIFGRSGEAGSLGLTGLQNLGNTCFMNSAIQCLAHTPKLVDYFLGDYCREINHDNPLGMDGEIALAFGELIRKIWAPGASPVTPGTFKSKLARFAPQFSGFNQHDSQELLAFLLDGLHEDLNRVKSKPYVEAKDGDGRPDSEVADEYWRNHLARNDSIIVDICQGQYKSTLVCPVCRKVSIMFDPFMYLSLPLPSTSMRTMTLTIISTDGSNLPSPCTISVPKFGKFEDLMLALSASCSLGIDETLLVAEVYNNRIIRFLEGSSDSLTLIRDADRLVAYRLKKDSSNAPLVIFMHHHMEEQYIYGKQTSAEKAFGIPLVGTVSISSTGSDIHQLYLKLLAPFHMPADEVLDQSAACGSTINEEVTESQDNACTGSTVNEEVTERQGNTCSGSTLNEEMTERQENTCSGSTLNEKMTEGQDNTLSGSTVNEEMTERLGNACSSGSAGDDSPSAAELEFYLSDEKGFFKGSKIVVDEKVPITGTPKRIFVIACWAEGKIAQYDTCLLKSLPEVFKYGSLPKRPQEPVSLYSCLEAFLKEEPLGPEDMWYCPGCKEHRQASKKLDLWRLPEILVIHLKRFSYNQYMKNKLETLVDFPTDDLDLETYISYKNEQLSHRYVLYAISNHFGSMGGGHYTAFVHHGGDRWYDFDDSHVSPVSRDKIKSSAAYVLFYRRVEV
ncbi:Ubiquitin carboxyl-terminal hydrolase 8, partial [Linum perenne]